MRLRNEEVSFFAGAARCPATMISDPGGSGRGGDRSQVVGLGSSGAPLWKRCLDVTCIILSLPVLLPVMGAISLGIFCVSPGSVLYLQERVGYRGRRFICFKFRTMKLNADASTHREHLTDLMKSNRPMTKMDGKDPRVIAFGDMLRASGLDELPQLLNVFWGQMSIVGPRPCVPYEYEQYQPEQKERFDTLPGLTGLWQVSGKNKTTFSEMIALDIRYARTKSLRLDLAIMAKTMPALLIQLKEARLKRKLSQRAAREVLASAPAAAAKLTIVPAEPVSRTRTPELVSPQ
jgi:lipopolysaccharide/colanic/teichoic acid biosynthesis glycosyltransferase